MPKIMKDFPSVSLLVATRNEAQHIEDCLNSIISQQYPVELLEILVIDGMSEDTTRDIVTSIIDMHENIRLIENKKIIQSAAWNLGIDLCQADVISIVSGHVTLAPDYVAKAVKTLQRTGADLVGGTIRAISSTKDGEAIALAMSHPFGVGGARHRYTEKEAETDSVFMGFCHRSVFEKIGKYDEELVRNQDDEFSYRLLKAGGRIICNPVIKSFYHSRSTYRSLWKQYYQYGFYKVRVLQKHPTQMRPRQFVPLLFVLAVIAAILSLVLPWGWLALASILSVYLLANIAVSLALAQKEGWQYLWRLPSAFATLHISYGLGFLVGLIKFYNRWGNGLGKVPKLKQHISDGESK